MIFFWIFKSGFVFSIQALQVDCEGTYISFQVGGSSITMITAEVMQCGLCGMRSLLDKAVLSFLFIVCVCVCVFMCVLIAIGKSSIQSDCVLRRSQRVE